MIDYHRVVIMMQQMLPSPTRFNVYMSTNTRPPISRWLAKQYHDDIGLIDQTL